MAPPPNRPVAATLEDAYRVCNPERELEQGSRDPYYADLSGGRGGVAIVNRMLEGEVTQITQPLMDRTVSRFGNDTYGKMAYESRGELAEVYRTQHLPKHLGYLAQKLLVLEYCNDRSWNDLHPCVAELPPVREALQAASPLADP